MVRICMLHRRGGRIPPLLLLLGDLLESRDPGTSRTWEKKEKKEKKKRGKGVRSGDADKHSSKGYLLWLSPPASGWNLTQADNTTGQGCKIVDARSNYSSLVKAFEVRRYLFSAQPRNRVHPLMACPPGTGPLAD
jgi:hypothetical protein